MMCILFIMDLYIVWIFYNIIIIYYEFFYVSRFCHQEDSVL